MAKLSREEVIKTKEYLESIPERVWFGSAGLTNTESDLFDTIQALQEEKDALIEHNAIYNKFVTTLCKSLKEHIEKDGYCRMIVQEEEVNKLIESLPKVPEKEVV